MFVQRLRGRATDTDALKRQLDTWYDDPSPGAKGWLGSTGGVTDDDSFIASFRFETPEAAQANSEKQTALETIWPVTQDLQYFDLRDPWLVSPKTG